MNSFSSKIERYNNSFEPLIGNFQLQKEKVTEKRPNSGHYQRKMDITSSSVFAYQEYDKYSSFEGASLDEITEWTLRLSNIDCLDKINAKVILLISYTSTRN